MPDPRTCYTLPAGSDPVVDDLDTLIDKSTSMIDAIYDSAVLANPKAFVVSVGSTPKQITPGTGIQITKNSRKTPVLVYIRMQMPETGVTGILYLSGDNASATTAGTAALSFDGLNPEATIVLTPNQTLYANCTSPDGTGNALNLVFSVIPLRGRSALYTEA